MLELNGLLSEVRNSGFDLNEILPDGKIHRFKNGRKNKKNGWYICTQVPIGGKNHHFLTVGDWSTNEKITLATKKATNVLEQAELAKEKKRLEALHKKLEKERKDRAAKVALRIVSRAHHVNGHDYIDKKKIRDDDAIKNIFQIGNKMIIPMTNIKGEIRSIQYIDDTKKLFLTGGETLGCFHKIEAKVKSSPQKAVLCEGYATGSSIYLALNKSVDVIVTFSAFNLPIVAKKILPIYGAENITAACDDDRWTTKKINGVTQPYNPGIEAGEKCFEMGIRFVLPTHTNEMEERRGSDFNDLYTLHGANSVAECFKPKKAKSDYEVESDAPEQIGFYYRYYVPKENGGVKIVDVPQYKLMADYCYGQKNMCFDDATSLRFDGKKWEWLTKNALNNFVVEQNEECIKPTHLDGFVKLIKSKCHEKSLGIRSPEALINVNNGVINVKTGELEPHSYKHLFRYCAEVDYVREAQCPRWENFLLEVFEKNIELVDLAQKLFGYIIIGGRPFLHRAFVLFGSGRNGKSTFLDILRAVVGHDSYSVVSMSKLDKEFSLVNVDGKLANIVEETPTDEINAEIFKNLVGGGEVQAAHKGFDEYSFRCNARFVFACNEMPIFKDKSIGLEDRLVFIPFNRYFKEDERDTEITEKLLAELPGILNWAIEGARLILRDKKLPQYEITKSAKEVYRRETNALYSWFCEEIEIDPLAPQIPVKEVYERYKKDCEENGNKPYSKDKFSKQIKQMVRAKCDELKIEFNDNLRDAAGSTRVFDVVRFKDRSLTGVTPQFSQLSGKNSWQNRYLDRSDKSDSTF